MIAYFQGARREFQKVVWPTRQQAVNHTLMVVGVSIIIAAFLGLVDYLLNLGLETVL
ncbi:MAG: preprotein translocase subunit SecE [Candidatus Kerfeldbacteria bacterium]|nr:preprotein translocase subunit SecE [Candidatus Kerfeldbacteria bacterium]